MSEIRGGGGREKAKLLKVPAYSPEMVRQVHRAFRFKWECDTQDNIIGHDVIQEDVEKKQRRSEKRKVACDVARRVMDLADQEGRPVTDYEVLMVLRLWEFRENVTRRNFMKDDQAFVHSDTVGLVVDYTRGAVVNAECRNCPEFGKLLSRWLKERLPEELRDRFVHKSININKNYAGALHRDRNNVGPSIIKAFGDFSGGELQYWIDDDHKCSIDVIKAKYLDAV